MGFKTITLPNSTTVELPHAPPAGDAGAADRNIAALAEGLNALSTSLTATIAALKVTASLANDAARTAGVPAFIGQLAVQLDTNILYRGTAVTAGSWTQVPPAA